MGLFCFFFLLLDRLSGISEAQHNLPGVRESRTAQGKKREGTKRAEAKSRGEEKLDESKVLERRRLFLKEKRFVRLRFNELVEGAEQRSVEMSM